MLRTANIVYDANARPVRRTLESGSTTHTLAQANYDALGRVNCTAQRMNQANFATIIIDACELGGSGAQGPDRITQTRYDAAGRADQVKTAVGTGDASNESTGTFTDNGQLETLTDAEGNRMREASLSGLVFPQLSGIQEWGIYGGPHIE